MHINNFQICLLLSEEVKKIPPIYSHIILCYGFFNNAFFWNFYNIKYSFITNPPHYFEIDIKTKIN